MHKIILPKILQPFRCNDLIRLGKKNDGGYLVNPNDLEKTLELVVFGLGEDISFEKNLIKKYKVNTYLYDSNSKVDIKDCDRALLNQINVGIEPNDIKVHTVLTNLKLVFLKCDIEGNEYKILNDILKYDNVLTGLIIEFHDISNYENFNIITNFIAKTRLKLVHLHVNNYMYYKTPNGIIPDVLELTFTSSENIEYDKSLELPNILDMPNNPNDFEFKVTF